MQAPVSVISHCWATIEPYIDVVSLISLSKLCHPLRNLVVDAATGKIKSSVIKVNEALKVDDEGRIAETIRDYVPRLINTVHFPSLIQLHIAFPSSVQLWNGEQLVEHFPMPSSAAGNHIFPAAFPMFAIQIENAINVEDLEVNVSTLIVHEEGGALQATYEILRDNLARCIRRTRKLKRLAFANTAIFEQGAYSLFSSAFLSAMVPAIKMGLRSLEEVSIDCGDIPSCTDYPKSSKEFFEAILGLQNLKKLRVQILSAHGPLLNDFVDASQSVLDTLGTFPSASLEYVDLAFHNVAIISEGQQPTSPRPSISPFLLLCHKAQALCKLRISIPSECWDANSIVTMSDVFNKLDVLSVNLNGHEDTSGNLISLLTRVIKEKPDKNLEVLAIGYHDEHSNLIEALGQSAEKFEHEGTVSWNFLHVGSPATLD
mmetsp:Transcript_23997/g.57937  ORF Transcript_23997/g.57937 Transcript_23997/m.57937 type:complete len:430 (+) Transcript_23997:86-1375(+)